MNCPFRMINHDPVFVMTPSTPVDAVEQTKCIESACAWWVQEIGEHDVMSEGCAILMIATH